MQGGIGGIIGNNLSGYFISKGHKARLISIGSLIMCVVLFSSTWNLLPPMFTGLFFAGLLFGGSIRMPAFQIILTEIIPINLRGRMMALSMINANITMGLGGIWSLAFLDMQNGVLTGMRTVTIIGAATLALIPLMVFNLEREIKKSDQLY